RSLSILGCPVEIRGGGGLRSPVRPHTDRRNLDQKDVAGSPGQGKDEIVWSGTRRNIQAVPGNPLNEMTSLLPVTSHPPSNVRKRILVLRDAPKVISSADIDAAVLVITNLA